MRLKSVCVILLELVSSGREWTIVFMFSIGVASKDVLVFSGIFVRVNVDFLDYDFEFQNCYN